MRTHSTPTAPNSVMLVHGLHQAGWCMGMLAKRLASDGFETYRMSYRSLRDDVGTHARRLNDALSAHHHQDISIDLVGHSMGGLVIRRFLHDYPKWQIGRIVTLGTPHLGSLTAKGVRHFAPFLVGGSYGHCLDGDCVDLPTDFNRHQLGIIAGDKPLGLGLPVLGYYQLKARFDKKTNTHTHDPDDLPILANTFAHDGTVYVKETFVKGAAHLILPVTHTAMLTDKEVARQTAFFLRHGRFDQSS